MTAELKGWWTISAQDFMDALKRVEDGEKADLIYAEWYANAEVTDYGKGLNI